MASNAWRTWDLPFRTLTLAVAIVACSDALASAQVSATAPTCADRRCRDGCIGHEGARKLPAAGPLGYGPPGIHPGFQGFGLGYHLGYGYGGNALGTAEGGYPFYGGPGYPHCPPPLRRIGKDWPFPHFGGPGYPTAERPNFYGETGPLIVDRPVISIDGGSYNPGATSNYGTFTGAINYPDSRFAPFTSRASGATLEMNPTGASPIVVPAPEAGGERPRNPSSSNGR